MDSHKIHGNHSHIHGEDCGHTAIQHGDHVDYVHDGCLHSLHGDHFDECKLEVSPRNPAGCHPLHDPQGHDAQHVHGPECGHEAVPHGDHIDYLVAGHLHHPHGSHCDDHGTVDLR